MQDAESDVNIVLATGSYRAEYTMLCHCARLLLHKLPEDRGQLIMSHSVLQNGTTTAQQSFTSTHTTALMPGLKHNWTAFGCKPQKFVNTLSRHTGCLSLIRPLSVSKPGAPPVADAFSQVALDSLATISTCFQGPQFATVHPTTCLTNARSSTPALLSSVRYECACPACYFARAQGN